MSRRSAVKLFALLITLPLLTVSWWDVGHMLTAAIAEVRLNQLNPYASVHFRELTLSINKMVDNRTRTFIESAVWADDLKGRQYNMDIWNEWHFVDTPYVTDATIPTINYTEAAFTSVWATIQARTVLKNNIDKNTAQRALFARYLVHLVGDIHQPLHSVALFNRTYHKGDMGGNLLKIKLQNGTVENFHSFWDSGAFTVQNDSYRFVRPMDMQNTTELKRTAQSMISEYGSKVEELAKNIDPSTWAKQSFYIAQNTTYPHMMNSDEATPEYTSLVYETSKQRITLAGYRLANFVIDIYENNYSKKSREEVKENDEHLKEQMKEYEQDLFEISDENFGKLMGESQSKTVQKDDDKQLEGNLLMRDQ